MVTKPCVSMPATSSRERNKEAAWHSFDPHSYVQHNYSTLRPDDKEIINIVRDFFEHHFKEHPKPPGDGIDVGTGPNLYPALSLLPWCEKITLYELAQKNLQWLQTQVKDYAVNWDPFWDELKVGETYRTVTDPRAKLAGSALVTPGDLFALGRQKWDIGTMFFVAESLSTEFEEFEAAMEAFIGALRPGSPFAAAFMEQSYGYRVADRVFPACGVSEGDVMKSLEERTESLSPTVIRLPPTPVRDGYTGMILVCGRTKPADPESTE